tara:strand:+ start:785 stop:1195 length:411 start_codon:yes stop_codon:yes gene_type:complete
MGNFIYKNNTNKEELFENNHLLNNIPIDDVKYIIYGTLKIIDRKISVFYFANIKFYEDFLIIKNNDYYEQISYYDIASWRSDNLFNIWSFNKKNKFNDDLLKYELHLSENYKSQTVSKLIMSLVKNLIQYKQDITS